MPMIPKSEREEMEQRRKEACIEVSREPDMKTTKRCLAVDMPDLLDALDEAEARIRELEKEIEHHSQTWQVRRIEDLESEIRDLRSAHRQRIPR